MREDQETKTRSLLEQASVLAASPTRYSEIRYNEYISLYCAAINIEMSLYQTLGQRPASGDEMLWQQLIGKDYASRDELARELGLALREQRLKAGLTQADLAERINMDEVSVRRWELGLRLPSIETLLLLEAVFIKDD